MQSTPKTADMPATEYAIEQLAELKTLNRTQAEAYVLREIERVPREKAADRLDISKSALDNRVQTAKRRLRNAEETLELIEDLAGESP